MKFFLSVPAGASTRWPGRCRRARSCPSFIARRAMRASRQVAECVPIAAMDFDGLVAFAREKKIDFRGHRAGSAAGGGPVGPVRGGGHSRPWGPSAAGAVLEGSKGFVKDLCAASGHSDRRLPALSRCSARRRHSRNSLGLPVVIKADGSGGRQRRHHRRDARRRDRGHRLHVRRCLRRERATRSWSKNSWTAKKRASSC